MTTYYFNFRDTDGTLVADIEGVELQTEDDVREEAVTAARQMMAERLRSSGGVDRSRAFEIADGDGNLVLTLVFGDALRN